MPKIFICYRREDSQWPAQLIYNNLVDHFGSESVVFDIDTIPLGADFRKFLNMEVSKCDILLAVIGDRWLEILNQRLAEPNDFVRIELQAALEREIPVVPILVGGKSVPSEKELPSELANLSYRQAAEVRVGLDLQVHLKRLAERLSHLFPKPEVRKKPEETEEPRGEEIPKTYTNSIGMEFVLIPPGAFTMGSSAGDEDEKPPHEVHISQSFYLQTAQVTQGLWQEIMGDNPSSFKDCGANCPVEDVFWDDTQRFIQKLNEMEGSDKYRLPTEAEWEYACRAGTTTEFSFGDDESQLEEYAWFTNNSQEKTQRIGTRKPNPWGLYDMHGNVWEWVADDWHKNYKGAPSDGSAWVDDPRGAGRVVRGGSWNLDARYCRSAYRNGLRPGNRAGDVGFRLSRSVALGP